jgi:hypothetical protein
MVDPRAPKAKAKADLKVVPFAPRETIATAISEDVVELLSDLMARAADGEVSSLAVAFVRPDGSVAVTWSACDQVAAQLGAITSLHVQYARLCSEDDV